MMLQMYKLSKISNKKARDSLVHSDGGTVGNFSSREHEILQEHNSKQNKGSHLSKRESLIAQIENKKSLQKQATDELLEDHSAIKKNMMRFIYFYVSVLVVLSILKFILMMNDQ